MATPVIETVTKDQWTKVATNVETGFIHKMSHAPNVYLQTYRDTGDAPPTLRTEGVVAFEDSLTEPIIAVAGIDVYLWVDKVDGQVRVDL
jgi:hypothetical protein